MKALIYAERKKNIICVSILFTLYHTPSGEENIEFNISTIFARISDRLVNYTQRLTTIGNTTMKLIVPLLETIAINNSFRYTKFFDDFHQGENCFLRRLGKK